VLRHLLSLHKRHLRINEFVFARRRLSSAGDGGRAMHGSLGEKIGEGVSADVHAWAPGQVVKLFKTGVSRRLSWHEAQKTEAVFAAGAPAPEVFGTVILEGRFGIVMQRLDGPTLLQLVQTGAMTRGQAGAILAALCVAVHKTSPLPDVPSLRDWVGSWLRGSGGRLPVHIATGVGALSERLSPVDELCHGDLHSGNVIMTAEGPRLIDWSHAVRAPAACDLAQTHMVLADLAAEAADDPARPRAVNAAAQSEYARLAGVSPAALTAAIESYLPIVRSLFLIGGAFPALRKRLIERVEAALLGPADDLSHTPGFATGASDNP
jgi:phosphotransferase family enzyme